jgi:hypothetical protein
VKFTHAVPIAKFTTLAPPAVSKNEPDVTQRDDHHNCMYSIGNLLL